MAMLSFGTDTWRDEDEEGWVCRANDVIHIHWLTRSDVIDAQASSSIEPFSLTKSYHPEFTHQVFEEEKIYGYKGLRIHVYYSATSMQPFYTVQYDEVVPSSMPAPNDVKAMMEEMMKSVCSCKDVTAFREALLNDVLAFKPIGTKFSEYAVDATTGKILLPLKRRAVSDADDLDDSSAAKVHVREESGGVVSHAVSFAEATDQAPKTPDSARARQFQLFQTSLSSSPEAQMFLSRLHTIALFFIDAASQIEMEDERWEVITLFEKMSNKDGSDHFQFVGYVTVYHFYKYPDSLRSRISQVFILPSYQRKGHGTFLYRAVFEHLVSNDRVGDIVVEDPNEQFTFLRDAEDLRMLKLGGDLTPALFSELESAVLMNSGERNNFVRGPELAAIVDSFCLKRKLGKKQARKLVEMLIYARFERNSEAREGKQKASEVLILFRREMKRRIYQGNEEELEALPQTERFLILKEQYKEVCHEYDLVFLAVERRLGLPLIQTNTFGK